MTIKITTDAKEEILEALGEMEQEAEELRVQEWQENEWYEDEELFRPVPIDYCPECGDSPYLRGTTCNNCGFPHNKLSCYGNGGFLDYPDDHYIFDWIA